MGGRTSRWDWYDHAGTDLSLRRSYTYGDGVIEEESASPNGATRERATFRCVSGRGAIPQAVFFDDRGFYPLGPQLMAVGQASR